MRAAAPLALEAVWDAAVDAEVVLAQAQVTFLDLFCSVGCCDFCGLEASGQAGPPLALEGDWATGLQLCRYRCCCLS